uniref:F-box domain-containing protein n=2 Tax=Lactuca sativa TaxID=4236 RepID=A0A9R1WZN4_LACSA|nr:hypothetical protein LSAT_V11C700358100 [Lactuca sativa]KAJ0197983.1 hypothetical protein LSAT_V11C700358090 [Lactuca sativa]
MENLLESLALEILSRLDDSETVACCRMASKTFNSVFPGLQFINLQWRLKWYLESRSRVSSSSSFSRFTPSLKRVFLNLVSNLSALESVHIGVEDPPLDVLNADVEDDGDDLHITDEDEFKKELDESDEDSPNVMIEGEPVEFSLELTTGAGVLCGISEAWT